MGCCFNLASSTLTVRTLAAVIGNAGRDADHAADVMILMAAVVMLMTAINKMEENDDDENDDDHEQEE